MDAVRIVAVIPVRMASSRFPGKPLLKIRGLPMVEHVRRRALLCEGFHDVVVATCDPEIAQVIRDAGGKVIMTSPTHPAATDRVAEAAESLECTHIVNVQGDEILALPADLEKMVRAIKERPSLPAWNAVAALDGPDELADDSVVKCVVSVSGRILFCSRNISCFSNGIRNSMEPVRKVLGILGYQKEFLQRYSRLPRTPMEVRESVDQSRILEHDFILQGVLFTRGYPGINLPHEVKQVESLLERDSLQREVLQQLLR